VRAAIATGSRERACICFTAARSGAEVRRSSFGIRKRWRRVKKFFMTERRKSRDTTFVHVPPKPQCWLFASVAALFAHAAPEYRTADMKASNSGRLRQRVHFTVVSRSGGATKPTLGSIDLLVTYSPGNSESTETRRSCLAEGGLGRQPPRARRAEAEAEAECERRQGPRDDRGRRHHDGARASCRHPRALPPRYRPWLKIADHVSVG